MTATYYFRVADFCFSLCLPCSCEVERLLPSFHAFRVAEGSVEQLLFAFAVDSSSRTFRPGAGQLIEETDNDMGHLFLYALPGGYYVKIMHNGFLHWMSASSDFSSVKACIQWKDPKAGNALSSLIRIAYAQTILRHNAVSMHASAVYCNGLAYLFMGKSGTGKSTHSALWMATISGAELLNDDNPTIRVIGDKVIAYGSPWSGKTPCYKNLSFPVGGIVRLRQSTDNRFYRQEGADAFVALYPGCSVIAWDKHLRDRLYDTLTLLAGLVATVGVMECRPDGEAARICYEALTKNI